MHKYLAFVTESYGAVQRPRGAVPGRRLGSIGLVAAYRSSAGQKGSHMRISGGLVICHESHQGQTGSRSGISAPTYYWKKLNIYRRLFEDS